MKKLKKKGSEQCRKIIDGMNDAVFICGWDGGFLSVNQKAVDRLGYTEEELLSMGLEDIDGLDFGENVVDRIQEIEKTGPMVFESIHVTKSGEKIPVEVSSSLITFRGEPAILSVARDIRSRKRMEEAIHNATSAMVSQIGSGELFKQIVDSAREISGAKFVVLSLYDRAKESVKTESLSGAGSSLLDRVSDTFEVEDLVGFEYPVEEASRFEKFSRRKEKEPLVLDGLYEYTFGMFSKQTCKLVEKAIGIEEILAVPLLNSDQELVGVLGYLFSKEKKDRNCTPLMILGNLAGQAIEKSRTFDRLVEARGELEEREHKLREGIKRYRKLTEASPDTILLVERESGEIIDANREAENLFKMPREEIIGKNLSELRPEEETDRYEELFEERETKPVETERPELHITDSHDNEIPVEIGTSTLELEGRKLTYGVFRNIKERKEAEEREDFLHSLLRHDVRNKVRTVQGYHELLKDFDLPDEAEDFLSKAESGVEDGVEIIEKVRSLRKAQQEEVRKVRIDRVMGKAVEQAKDTAKDNGIEIETNLPEEGLEVCGGSLLNRVFSNLIENAVQHSGGSKIRISGETTEEEVICSIEDNGKGIPADEKDKILDKGYTTDKERGTGLGLFLVKTLLEIYGGSIEVKDSNLGGARFDIRLKRA